MSEKENRNNQISESLVRLVMLRFLNSRYPNWVNYEDLMMNLKTVGCSDKMLRRVFGYLKEKKLVEEGGIGSWEPDGRGIGLFEMRITSNGIDYLEVLEKEVHLKVEEDRL